MSDWCGRWIHPDNAELASPRTTRAIPPWGIPCSTSALQICLRFCLTSTSALGARHTSGMNLKTFTALLMNFMNAEWMSETWLSVKVKVNRKSTHHTNVLLCFRISRQCLQLWRRSWLMRWDTTWGSDTTMRSVLVPVMNRLNTDDASWTHSRSQILTYFSFIHPFRNCYFRIHFTAYRFYRAACNADAVER